jgi:two-component system cell cycle response regulator
MFAELQYESFRHVLLVDDDRELLSQNEKALRDAGYEVERASTGEQAIEILRRRPPNFLVTDWDHEGPLGPELCQWVREEKLPQYVFTMLLSSRRQTRDVVQGLAAGADGYLFKPTPQGELIARLAAGSRLLEVERRLSLQASQDPLTGLFNRRNFFDIFKKEWIRCERYGYPLSCVMIDIDHFKRINDTRGHIVGDEALIDVARTIERSCRASDWVCRFGGEEFCVLLVEADITGATLWAERTRQTLSDQPVSSARVSITASFGVAQKSQSATSPEHLLDLADQALLAAKRAGRNRVEAAS